jgi:hypothetical protein
VPDVTPATVPATDALRAGSVAPTVPGVVTVPDIEADRLGSVACTVPVVEPPAMAAACRVEIRVPDNAEPVKENSSMVRLP